MRELNLTEVSEINGGRSLVILDDEITTRPIYELPVVRPVYLEA